MKRIGKISSIIFAFALTVCLIPQRVLWAEETGAKSENIHHESYYSYWSPWENTANVVKSYLIKNSDTTLERIEFISPSVVIERYNEDGTELLVHQTLSMELPVFGGFFEGEKFNYIVYGQENLSEDDNCEVYRIVRYGKDWKRLGSDSLYGANTYIPFKAGSLRMCEQGGYLYIRTCHQMYKKEDDGCRHQANVTISYNENTDKIVDSFYKVWNISNGYVSHSFNQFAKMDGANLITADHGDAYPRSLVLCKYSNLSNGVGVSGTCANVNICPFDGDIGDNYTGCMLGGLEVLPTKYILAYSRQVASDNSLAKYSSHNIYIGMVDKDNFDSTAVKTIQLTNYSLDDGVSALNPFLIKVANNDYVVMWETAYTVTEYMQHSIQYVHLNQNGEVTGEVQTVKGDLSDCQPIVVDKKLQWYVTDDSEPVFYSLDLDTDTISSTYKEPVATATPEPTVKPTDKPILTATKKPSVTTAPTGQGANTTSVTKNGGMKVKKPGKVTWSVAKNKAGKRVYLKWKKKSCDGYEIYWSRNRSFKSKKKTVAFGASEMVYFLKKNKNYYFKVRAYKYGGSGKVYGTWSNVKKVKVKR